MDTFMDKLASRLNAQEMIRANSQAEAKESERLNKEVEVYKQCLEKMREILEQNTDAYDDVAELVKTSMDKIALIQAEGGKSDEVLEAMEKRTAAVMNAVAGSSDEVMKAVSGNTDVVMGALSGNSNKVMNAVSENSGNVIAAVSENTDKILAEISGLQTDNDGLKEAIVQEVLAEIKKELKVQEENVHKECVKVYRNVQAVVTEDNDKQTKLIIDNQTKMKKKATAALVCGILAMSFAAAGLVVSVLDVFGVFAMLF